MRLTPSRRAIAALSLGLWLSTACALIPTPTPPPTAAPTATLAPTIAALALPPEMAQAKRIDIGDNWDGLSLSAPIKAQWRLDLGGDGYTGKATFSVGGRRGAAKTATADVTLPAAVAQQFIAALAASPLTEGTYKPSIEHTDDYPSIGIALYWQGGSVLFSSTSNANNYVPWQVQIGNSASYIINSPAPTNALKLINAYLKRDVLDGLIQSTKSS